jgi:2-polyprenyl-6-methoxyphenol hydroxylase-like FAD-dependent oxidoreductase
LQRGFKVEVFEQAPELKEVGAGVQISANGTRILFDMGLRKEIMALASEATGKEIRLWNTGRTWKLFDLGAMSIERYAFLTSPFIATICTRRLLPRCAAWTRTPSSSARNASASTRTAAA